MTDAPSEPKRLGVGIYLADTDYALMKAAFRAAFLELGGPHDTLATWIAGALQAHAARTHDERVTLAQDAATQATSEGWRGRTFQIPAAAVLQMRTALAQDTTLQWSPTESAWARAAITAAITDVQTALTNRGQHLEPWTEPLPRARLRRPGAPHRASGRSNT